MSPYNKGGQTETVCQVDSSRKVPLPRKNYNRGLSLNYTPKNTGDYRGLAETLQLRPYQKKMIGETYRHIGAGIQRALLVIIMGAGKTYIASCILRDAAQRSHKGVFLVALNVLLEQTAASLKDLGLNATILQGSRAVDPNADVIVASCQTIAARLRRSVSLEAMLGNPKVIVVDEAHNTAFLSVYRDIEQHYLSQGAVFIGLTATPWRLSKKEWLGQRFDALVEGPQPPDIIKMGGALPCRGYTITGVLDLDNLHVSAGEYIDGEIASQATQPEALKHVVREWQRLCQGRPTLMVGATVEQAHQTEQALTEAGILAETIVGSTPQDERLAIFERVKSGETQVICSVGCLTAGFNLPAIAAILYVRATKSKALFHQTAGRGSRPHPGKSDYLLLDFGGNLKRLGNPMGWQVYDISEPIQDDKPAPTKTCPQCSAEVSNFARVCPHCGFEFVGEGLEEEPEDLILLELNEFVDRFTRQKIKELRKWRKEAYQHDINPDEPINRFVAEYGHTPPMDWVLHAALGKRVSKKRKLTYVQYLERHCKQGQWANQWRGYQLQLEFGVSNLEKLSVEGGWSETLEIPYTTSFEDVKRAYANKIKNLPDDHPDQETFALAFDDARLELLVEAGEEVSA